MEPIKKMLSVTQVARRTNLTVRALHHHGALGLLLPPRAARPAIACMARPN